MKILGFILGIVIFILIGIIPIIAIGEVMIENPEIGYQSYCINYLALFFAINIYSAAYYSYKFYQWFKSNLKN